MWTETHLAVSPPDSGGLYCSEAGIAINPERFGQVSPPDSGGLYCSRSAKTKSASAFSGFAARFGRPLLQLCVAHPCLVVMLRVFRRPIRAASIAAWC